jgi:carbamoyl-phosphate synthase large subunit
VLVRPSYVLGGQGMEICYTEENLKGYLDASFIRDPKNPVLIDKYLNGIEIEIDAICDGDEVLIPGIMEHLERAGIHSGDSITVYPQQNLYPGTEEKILEITRKLAKELEVVGMMNIQFIAYENQLYIIEVNPRSSRTVPYISKVSGVPMIELATKVMLGEKLSNLEYGTGIYKKPDLVAVKVPVFSTEKLSGVEVSLGPEMKSTGEVLGIGNNMDEAIYKGLVGGYRIHEIKNKRILATIKDTDKEEFLGLAKRLVAQGCTMIATEGTANFLEENGVPCERINKISEPSPNIIDKLKTQQIDLLINTPTKANDSLRDGFRIRRTAIEYGVEVLTSLDTLNAVLNIMKKDVNKRDLDILRKADTIIIDELKASGYYDKTWQAFAVLLNIKSVGVMGDNRTYENTICIRMVEATDGMTATFAKVPYDILEVMSRNIINKVEGINRVVYDISSKPPATIEWE